MVDAGPVVSFAFGGLSYEAQLYPAGWVNDLGVANEHDTVFAARKLGRRSAAVALRRPEGWGGLNGRPLTSVQGAALRALGLAP